MHINSLKIPNFKNLMDFRWFPSSGFEHRGKRELADRVPKPELGNERKGWIDEPKRAEMRIVGEREA